MNRTYDVMVVGAGILGASIRATCLNKSVNPLPSRARWQYQSDYYRWRDHKRNFE
jgi:hypothetical protein